VRQLAARALARRGQLGEADLAEVLEEKRQAIAKSELLEYCPSEASTADIGGLEALKHWLEQRHMAFSEEAMRYGLPLPRGVLLVGPQGTGKSLTAKAVAHSWSMPLLRLDVGRLFAGLVGASEARTRDMIQRAEAMAPCVLWIDEIDKGFGGDSRSDGGTSQRVLGTVLTWMAEKTSAVFVVATANDVASLPAAPDGTPAADDFLAGAVTECAVSTDIWANVYGYDTTKFTGEAPKTAADFFDLEKFPGKRGLRKGAKAVLEFALIGDGVPVGEVYATLSTPEGVERALAKLDSIKAEVVWWEAGSQAPQLLADGEVVMTTAYNGRLFAAAMNEGKPFQIVWDGQVYENEMFVVPKGAPNMADAMEFIAFATSTEGLRASAQQISYGPARKSSMAEEIIYKDGKMLDLDPRGKADFSIGFDISDKGDVIGFAGNFTTGEFYDFLYTEGRMWKLKDLISPRSPLKGIVDIYFARIMTANGYILADGFNTKTLVQTSYILKPMESED
jgi:ABC-type Fe3+ transport system substrate-binding protein